MVVTAALALGARASDLYDAVAAEDTAAIARLLGERANHTDRGPDGLTPLMLAATRHPSMVAPLLANGSSGSGEVDERGRGAVILAVQAGNYPAAMKILEWGGEDHVDRRGLSAFDYAVRKDRWSAEDEERIAFIEMAMERWPAFSGWGRNGKRPVPVLDDIARELCPGTLSPQEARVQIAVWAVATRAQFPEPSQVIQDALLCAARKGRGPAVFAAFQKLNADSVTDERGYSPLLIMIDAGHDIEAFHVEPEDVLREAIENGADRVAITTIHRMRRQEGAAEAFRIALVAAIEKKKSSLIESLLEAGAAEGAESEFLDGALSTALSRHCIECLPPLLDAGASYPGTLDGMAPEIKALIEADRRQRRPPDSQLQEEELAAACAAYPALAREWKGKAYVLRVRHMPTPAACADVVIAAGFAADPDSGALLRVHEYIDIINVTAFAWVSPARVRVTGELRGERRQLPDEPPPFSFSSGWEVLLEKQPLGWTAVRVRNTWVE